MVSIANNSNLSKHVRNLTITNDFIPTAILDPSGFVSQVYITTLAVRTGTQRPPRAIDPEAASFVTFESFIETGFKGRPGLKKQLNDAGWSSERLFSTWQRNKEIAIEQKKLMTSDTDVESLATALKTCRNLETVRLTGGSKAGGVEKLLRNGLGETFIYGEIYRADGRQVTALLLAGAKLSETEGQAPNAKFSSLIMEENYWDELCDKHTYNKTYVAREQRHQPHFGSISASTIASALPFFSSITTLDVSLPSKNGDKDVLSIERNLTLLLAGLPNLQRVSLHNSEYQLVSLQRPIKSILSTSIHTLKLQNCVIHLSLMETFLSTQASTLSTIHLENIALVGGHYDKFLSALRETVRITEFVTKGWLLEFADETCFYEPDDEFDDEEFELINKRRDQARRGIAAFVQRERKDLPVEFLDVDPSCSVDFDAGRLMGIIECIGETKFEA